MLTRKSLVRTAQVLCMGTATALVPIALATPASAAPLPVMCSEAALHGAIDAANNSPGSDTLNLAPRCTYLLYTELPPITSPIVINGNGDTIASVPGTFRILTVDGGSLTLAAATLTNGDATGSSIRQGEGGAIVVTDHGSLSLARTLIAKNRADFGGGVSVFGDSQAQVTRSVFTGNTAGVNGGALTSDGNTTVRSSHFSENTAGNVGGAIANTGMLTVNGSTLLNNTAPNGGGGLANEVTAAPGGTSTVSGSVISGNSADGVDPGGIYNDAGTVTLRASVVIRNTPNNCLNSPSPVPDCRN
ncbi:right-handed parallel beta-helix repeat-containing protein [Streptomyces sp. NPDC052052]|uniref:right-handed parallel beta-helix repeat-containing protein n=1 Tax=Streptomyces sp. NPDC052052 TaxID=3154756 RepID=UPI003446D208